jgi:hypothetical protein
MTKSTTLILALLCPLACAAADRPAATHPKAASFVPHAQSKHHVYGAPIAQPIVGHAKAAPQKTSTKKKSPSAAHHKAQ